MLLKNLLWLPQRFTELSFKRYLQKAVDSYGSDSGENHVFVLSVHYEKKIFFEIKYK